MSIRSKMAAQKSPPIILAIILLHSLATPSFCDIEKPFKIPESTPVGSLVGYLSDRSLSSEQNSVNFIMHYPRESDVAHTFAVDERTGEIRTRTTLDRETRSTYTFLAIPTSGAEGIRVSVHVLDENDHAPKFPVGAVNVQDEGIYGVQAYRIVTGNVNNAFRLSTKQVNGVLYLDLLVNSELDREFRASYTLEVEAADGGDPPLTAKLLVNVTIVDANDNAPEFDQTRYRASVPYNATIGAEVLRVRAVDRDAGVNGQVRYKLMPSPFQSDQRFSVDSRTGAISVAQPLALHDARRYELLVAATDGGAQPLDATAFVQIDVVDAGTHGAQLKVTFLTSTSTSTNPSISRTVTTISEGSPTGQLIARVAITDIDPRRAEATSASEISMLIGQGAGAGGERHFEVTPTGPHTFLLVLHSPVDREQYDRHDLQLSARDRLGLLAASNVTVYVSDENDNAPQFTQMHYRATVRETATIGGSVLKVTASDADADENSKVTYSIVESAPVSNWFSIDPDTGLIVTRQTIDCSVNSEPTIEVEAVDGGRPPLKATARVTMRVVDANDNAPVFDQPIYNVTLPEDMEENTCFLEISANDTDCGANAQITYSINTRSPRIAQASFGIDPKSGKLCLKQPLDYETHKDIQLQVDATDGGGTTSTALVQVHIADKSDTAPTFYPSTYNVSVRHDAAVGQPLLVVSAVDLDDDGLEKVEYELREKSLPFRVDGTSGELYVSGALTSDTYMLSISATDRGGLSAVVPATVAVTVLRPGLVTPHFEQMFYRFNVREDTFPGIGIGRVVADGPKPLVYAIYSGDPMGLFEIDQRTGVISLREYVDADTQPSIMLNVQAGAGHPTPTYNYTQVEIIVGDVNDNAPVFELERLTAAVGEMQRVGRPFFIVRATDKDSGRNGEITYRLESSSPPGPFVLRPLSGELLLTSNLDYETQRQYNLSVVAHDGGIPIKSAAMLLTVNVLDENDNEPVFEKDEYDVEVQENVEIMHNVVKVTATDKDSGRYGRITYLLTEENSSPDGPQFAVYADSGWVYIRLPLDRETRSIHKLRVVARDGGDPQLSAASTITVRVSDVNDNKPKCDSISRLSISEAAPVGSLVGSISALDPDLGPNGTVLYALQRPEPVGGYAFRLEPSGLLYTTRSLDADTDSTHTLAVIARDSGLPTPLQSSCTCTVTVLDENDNEPYFVLPHASRVPVAGFKPGARGVQPGQELVQVRANDPDAGENGTVVYDIVPDRFSDLLSIDRQTGVLRAAAALSPSSLRTSLVEVTIRASDLGHPAKSATKQLVLELPRVSEYGFEGAVQGGSWPSDNGNSVTQIQSADDAIKVEFEISEDAPIGRMLGAVDKTRAAKSMSRSQSASLDVSSVDASAAAAELSLLADVSYEIVAGNSQRLFEVDRVTSVLYLAKPLDYETAPGHHLKVNRVDESRPGAPLRTAFDVTVLVLDENDNAPVFPQDPVIFSVAENATVKHLIAHFNASDLDAGAAGRLRYRITSLSPDHSEAFQLDPVTGELRTAVRLDHEQVSEYLLVVAARDQAEEVSKRRESTVAARVYVTDINDNRPVIVSDPGCTVFEDHPAGHPFFHVLATDADSHRNGLVSYKIMSGNEMGYFALNHTTGALTLVRRFERGSAKRHDLKITVSDAGSPPLHTEQTLSVTVRPVTDNAPRFAHSIYTVNVSEAAPVNTVLARLAATSGRRHDDLSHEASLVFVLPPSVGDGQFRLHATDGTLQLARRLDAEIQTLYEFTVYARDSVHPYLFDAAKVLIHVADENDNSPQFSPATCAAIQVPENTEVAQLHKVLAYDADVSSNEGNVKYELRGGDGKFHLDPISGRLACTALDREKRSNYTLQLVAKDAGGKTDSCNITVHVIDQDDNAPIFEQQSYGAEIPENTRIGTVILKVKATDKDQGYAGVVKYSLESSEGIQGKFEIDPVNGDVALIRHLDYEATKQHNFRVVATDGGLSTPHVTKANITIRVLDINDNPPTFIQQSPYYVALPLSLSAGGRVAKITAIDPDSQGDNSEVTYSLSDPHGLFVVNPTTGVVSVRRALKGSQVRNRFHLTVTASDRGTPPLTTKCILVLHAEGSSPRGLLQFIDGADRAVKLEKTVPEDTLVATVTAQYQNGENEQEIVYSIASGDDEGIFKIDTWSGDLRVALPDLLSTTNRKNITLVISAAPSIISHEQNDIDMTLSYARLTVVLHSGRSPDSQPQFMQQRYVSSVREAQHRGAFVAQVSAMDADSPVTYSIIGGNVDSAFAIDPSGVVTTNQQLDREIIDDYELDISATSGANGAKTKLSVTVIDVNDNMPSFPPMHSVVVSENTPIGSELTILSANDVDSGPPLQYTLLEDHGGTFFLQRYSGRLILARKLDFEQKNAFELMVEASDTIHTVRGSISLEVLDENEHAPIFDQPFYRVSVPENTRAGVSLITVQAVDADGSENNNAVRYELPADFNPPGWRIDRNSGAIYTNKSVTTKSPLDRLVQLVVHAVDNGAPREKRSVATVQITVVNGEGELGAGSQPKFDHDRYKFTVSEAAPVRTTVGRLGVQSPHLASFQRTSGMVPSNDNYEFRIESGDPSRHFDLSADGTVSIAKMLDREAVREYRLVVSVSTRSNSITNSTCVVLVMVEDYNDNVPEFDQSGSMEVSIKENTPVGTTLYHVFAHDDDDGLNGQVLYSIVSGNELDIFTLDETTGVLILERPVNRYMRLRPTLTIKATDRGDPPQYSVATLHLRILAENNQPPIHLAPLHLARIREDAPIGTALFTVRATDPDEGDFGKVSYTLHSTSFGSGMGLVPVTELFSVDELTGQVVTKAQFDYEQSSGFRFSIRATDGGGKYADTSGQVLVQGVDEFAPEFARKLYVFDVPLEGKPGDLVGTVTATDQDQGADGQIHYSLEHYTDYFHINTVTGVLTIQRSVKPLYRVRNVADVDSEGGDVKARVTRAAEHLRSSSGDVQPKDGVFVQVLHATVRAASGPPGDQRSNSTQVELRIGPFAAAGTRPDAFKLNIHVITVVSVVLVLCLILILVCLVCMLRNGRNGKGSNTPSVSARGSACANNNAVFMGSSKRASKRDTARAASSISGAVCTCGELQRDQQYQQQPGTGARAQFVSVPGAHRHLPGCSHARKELPPGPGPARNGSMTNGSCGHNRPLLSTSQQQGKSKARHRLPPAPLPPRVPSDEHFAQHRNGAPGHNGTHAQPYSMSNLSSARDSALSQHDKLEDRMAASHPDSGIHVMADNDELASIASDLPSTNDYLTSLGVTLVPTGGQNNRYGYHNPSAGVYEPPRVLSAPKPPVTHHNNNHNVNRVVAFGTAEYVDALNGGHKNGNLVNGNGESMSDVHDFIYSKVNEVLAEGEGDRAGTSRPLPDTLVHPSALRQHAGARPSDQLPPLDARPLAPPSYQPLTQVFSEISKMRQDTLRRQKRPCGGAGDPTAAAHGGGATLHPPAPVSRARTSLAASTCSGASQQQQRASVASSNGQPNVWLPNFAATPSDGPSRRTTVDTIGTRHERGDSGTRLSDGTDGSASYAHQQSADQIEIRI